MISRPLLHTTPSFFDRTAGHRAGASGSTRAAGDAGVASAEEAFPHTEADILVEERPRGELGQMTFELVVGTVVRAARGTALERDETPAGFCELMAYDSQLRLVDMWNGSSRTKTVPVELLQANMVSKLRLHLNQGAEGRNISPTTGTRHRPCRSSRRNKPQARQR